MSAPGPESVGGSLVAAQATEPSWVRNGSGQVQQEYAVGLEFERLLVQQLSGAMTETTESSGEEEGQEGSSGGATSVLSSMLPGALAQGVVNGGGLGLAAELTKDLEGTTGASTSTGATAPAPAQAPASDKTTPAGGVEAGRTGGATA